MLTRSRAVPTAAALVRRAAVAGVAALALGGCYTQTPLTSLPTPGTSVVAELNDAGRVAMAVQVGPSVTRIEGLLDSARTDSEFILHVTNVSTIGGYVYRWAGEPATLRPAFVQAMFERHLSKGRTWALAGSVAVVVGVFAFTRGLGVLGSGSDNPPQGGQNPNSNSRWVHP